jgi:1-acyl-sn-glycerol-3-phosphate acyltransferase
VSSSQNRSESLTTRWVRRSISVPLYFGLAMAGVLLAPLWLPLALVVDCLTGKVPLLPRTRALIFFTHFLWCEVGGVVGATLIWFALAGGLIGGPEKFVAANAALQRGWTAYLFKGFRIIFSMKVEVEGLDVAKDGPLLLFVRHSSTADTVLAATLVANPHKLLLKYVLKRELLWDPCLDIVGQRLPNAFIDRKAPKREGELQAVLQLAENLTERLAVLIYPEGTRFSESKQKKILKSMQDKGMGELFDIAQSFRMVLPPKLGGPLGLMDAAPGVDIVLLEHSGFEGAANFSRFWNGALVGRTIRVRLRRLKAENIPVEKRDRWLFERWAEMDDWIVQSMRDE